MYELYMAMNPKQREDFETAINRFEMQIERQERLVSLEQEFANYKSKMEADLKKYQSGMVKWKKLGNSMVAIRNFDYTSGTNPLRGNKCGKKYIG
ncbi:hypothetical protein Tco_0862489 [Tanacetum coccineum]